MDSQMDWNHLNTQNPRNSHRRDFNPFSILQNNVNIFRRNIAKTDWFLFPSINNSYFEILFKSSIVSWTFQGLCLPNWATLGQQGHPAKWFWNPQEAQHSTSSQTLINICSLVCFSNLVRPIISIIELLCPDDISIADSRSLSSCKPGWLLQVALQCAQALIHACTYTTKKCLNITFRVFYYDQQLYLATFLFSIREDTLPNAKKGICQMQQLEQKKYY